MLPISYGDALPLLRALGGPVAPAAWRGALPITYHLGPGPARVHLKLEFDWKLAPAYDVIARLPGAELADQWILRGNHHDAWVHGASDPISGMVALLEEARAIGAAGEEPVAPAAHAGLRGLGRRGAGPARIDRMGRGRMPRSCSEQGRRLHQLRLERPRVSRRGRVAHAPALRERGRARREDPQRERLRAGARARASSSNAEDADERKEMRERRGIALDAARLRIGLHALPAAPRHRVAELRLRRRGEYGVYHSAYDSVDHFTRFVDPNFDYGITQAKTTGPDDAAPGQRRLAAVRGIDFAETARVPQRNDEARGQDAQRRSRSRIAAARQDDGAGRRSDEAVRRAEGRRRRRRISTSRRCENAVARLQKSARRSTPRHRATTARVDASRARAHAATKACRGGPGFAITSTRPGFYTGYGVKTLPGVREAIEQRKWAEANAQIVILAGVLDRYAECSERRRST